MKLRLRSHRVVQEEANLAVAAAAEVDKDESMELVPSGWANLPNELLRLVLERIEAEESKWPARKHVVACAGVCKGWREILKELVKPLVVSGTLTFPISVKQPGPRDSLLQCFIRRKNSSQTYHLYLSLNQALADDGKFILTAKKCRRTTCTEYIISLLTDDMLKGNKSYIGKLRSNFLGTKFVVYDALPPSGANTNAASASASNQASPRAITGNYPVSHISYELNVLGARRGPRRMHVVMDPIPASSIRPDGSAAPTQLEFPANSSADHFSMFRSRSSRLEKSGLNETDTEEKSLVLKNKNPRWHEQLQCWCLNFHGRVTVASVKNFQLVASPEGGPMAGGPVAGPDYDKVVVQFGKVGKDVFTMDYKYPLSAFQAFAICLSSFDTKIACE